MWCARCSRGRRTRSEARREAAAEALLQAQQLREEADRIEQQTEQQLDQLDQDEQGEGAESAERAARAWARFLAHQRRLARLRRIWAFLGHHLREIANRRGEPRRRRR